ncbi:choice-of-anchor I family protein [Cyanobium sp. FACHB-13342]|uniref:choice-of-anchor I family protein n=1 Tax=Cyanobium sp. FACHB-13342 TaxID=2692793 RepID=UPI00167FEF8F|nr:choice-of-anchor I family protein [Cyanobium sp. FACHB-13342]MBD2424080.1 choice-of-anchor I family protein [Cyanobium sp. FACHB-13342]
MAPAPKAKSSVNFEVPATARKSESAVQVAAPAVANSYAFLGQPADAPEAPLLGSLNLTPTGTSGEQFQTEISAAVTIGGTLFVFSSGGGSTLQVTDATTASAPVLLERVSYGGDYLSTSVASYGNLLAVALSPADYDTNGGLGLVRFYRVGVDGTLTQIADVAVGYLPDGIAFNETGTKLVIANEGQPAAGYTLDRPGSIGIIDITGRAGQERFSYTDLGFAGITLPEGLRLSGPAGTTQANDIEPEYVSILGNYAYVTLQENNAVAKVNLATKTIETIFSLGTVDYSTQLVDLTDKDGGFKPLLGQAYEGLRMPDGIAAYSVNGKDYFITANEGDGREYGTYTDEARGSGNANRVKRLTDDANVGTDLTTTFGSRSITIFDADTGALLWDSGNTLQTIAFAAGVYDDGRSDDKGVEPEGVVVAKVDGRSYAIVSLERGTSSMLAVFDVSDPSSGQFVTSTVIAGSVSPEGLKVVEARQSPTGRAQLLVSNEISNTLNVFDLEALIAAPPVAGAGTFASTMLMDVAGGPELKVTSLITNGEFTNGLNPGDSVYAPTGIFDGQGAYENGDGSYTLLVNSELGADRGYGYLLPGVEGGLTGARVSSLVIDKDVDDDASNGYQSAVIAGGLAYDSIYLDGSATAIDQAADLGAGFKRFCAANLVEANSFGADTGFADRIYLVGEEEFSGDGGSFFALDVNGRAIHEVVGFGKGTWESATIINTGSTDTVAVLLFDDAKAPLYMWVGTKSAAADASFLERNGLAASQGTLYTFVTTALLENGVSIGPDSSDLFAFTQANGINVAINGSWVDLASLDPNYASLGAPALRQLAVNAGALQLSRIEDGEVNPLNSQQAVFVSTGTADFNKGDLYGNVYTLDFSDAFGSDGLVAASGESVLKVVYDGDLLADPTTGIRNPDNMTISADGYVYLQEDRANGGGTNISAGNFGTQEASIWQLAIDPITGDSIDDPTRWAQIDRTAVPTVYGQTDPNPADYGNWESSGIIDVSAIYGEAAGSLFLADVEAHNLTNGNIGSSGYLVQGGQLTLIQNPDLI